MTLGLHREQTTTLKANDGTQMEICVAPLPALEASKLQMELQSILGPLLINLVGAGDPKKGVKLDKFSIAAIVNLLKESDVHTPVLLDMAEKFRKKSGFLNEGGKWRLFQQSGVESVDHLFAGQMEMFWGWIKFGLEVNFKSFLDSLKSVANGAESVQNQSKTQE